MTAASSALGGGLALVRNRRWDYLAADAPARAVYAEIFNGRTGPSNHVRYVLLDDQTGSGFKFGTWHDVAWTELILPSGDGQPPEPN